MNTNQIEEESISISLGIALQKNKLNFDQYIKRQEESPENKIKELDNRLVISVEIITPIQLHSYSFRKELKTYRYERKPKVDQLFVDTLASGEREVQQMFSTFKAIFSQWRNNINNKFYMVFNNRDLFYFFHKVQPEIQKQDTKKGGSFLVLGCRKTNYEQILKNFGIKYEYIEHKESQGNSLLLKNNDVQLFWRYLTNSFMQKPTQAEFVSNFYFMNSTQILPVELYNGKQQRPQFSYIAHKKINILEEVETQMYSIKMEGYWFKQNIENLYKRVTQMCKGNPFHWNFQCHYGSTNMKEFYEDL